MQINNIQNIKFLNFGKIEQESLENEPIVEARQAVDPETIMDAAEVKAQMVKGEIAMNSEVSKKAEEALEMKERALKARDRAEHLKKELDSKLEETAYERRNSMRKNGDPNFVEKYYDDNGKPQKLFMYYPNNKLKLASYFNEDGSCDAIQCDKEGNIVYSKNQVCTNLGTKPFLYKTLEEIKVVDGDLIRYSRNVSNNVRYGDVRKDAELLFKIPFCIDYSEGICILRSGGEIQKQTTIYSGDSLQTYCEGITTAFPKREEDYKLVLCDGKVTEFKKGEGKIKKENW